MSDPLTVLLLEDAPGASGTAADALVGAGHRVVRCHAPGRRAFPCAALVDGQRCPLEADAVDVALDVCATAHTTHAPLEDGVRCALVHQVPLVVAGDVARTPFDEFATDVHPGTDDVVAACERAAAAPLARHTTIANDALVSFAARRGLAHVPTATVRRKRGSLVVEVCTRDRLDATSKAMASVRVTAALRRFDAHARGIDVVFAGRDPLSGAACAGSPSSRSA
jgi:hypothetical protein